MFSEDVSPRIIAITSNLSSFYQMFSLHLVNVLSNLSLPCEDLLVYTLDFSQPVEIQT